MIKVMQTIFSSTHGNCFQACVASIFELSLEDVPHFLNGKEDYMGQWWDDYIVWLDKFGLSSQFSEITREHRDGWVKYLDKLNCYALAGIKHESVYHAVVIKGSKIVHNPWPMYSGNNDEPLTDFSLVAIKDPSKYMARMRTDND